MKNFRVGIIGCGNIFPMHALPIKNLKNATLVAVCDIEEDIASKTASEFSCASYVDYEKMINEENLDVIHICTPHYLHSTIAIYACERGVNVITEKPMSITLNDANKMIASADKNKVTLAVIFQNRYNQSSILAKETLESGKLGEILCGKLSLTWCRTDDYYLNSKWKGTWGKEGGGVIIDQAIHTIDIINWLISSDIEYVDAVLSNRAHKTIEVEDAAEGVIAYKNGIYVAFHAINYYSYDAPVEIELFCEHGKIKIVGDKVDISFNNGKTLSACQNPNETFNYGNCKSYWGVNHIKQINNFYSALEFGLQPDITGKTALNTQKLICAIYNSSKQCKKIFFTQN